MYQAMGRPDEATANDVLAWWRFHETTYPNLAELAREVFPIQGSSCSSERVFCHSGGVLTDKRSCTDPRNVGDLVFFSVNSRVSKFEHLDLVRWQPQDFHNATLFFDPPAHVSR